MCPFPDIHVVLWHGAGAAPRVLSVRGQPGVEAAQEEERGGRVHDDEEADAHVQDQHCCGVLALTF